ncbi:MAG: polysaccharide biosynthesis tyrosine autokinase [bacterium]
MSENTPHDPKHDNTTKPMLYHNQPYSPYSAYNTPYYGGVTTTPGSNDFNLIRLIRVAKQRWLTILLVALFGTLSAEYKLFMTTKLYEATSLIELRVRRPRIMNREDAVLNDSSRDWQSDRIYNTRLQKFMSPSMHLRVMNRLKEQGAADPLLVPSASFTLLPDSHIVSVTCISPSPSQAATGANAYAEEAVSISIEENKAESEGAVKWLYNQAAQQRKAVEAADSVQVEFRRQHRIDLMESRKRTAEQAVMDFSRQLVAIQAELELAKKLLQAVEKPSTDFHELDKLPPDVPLAAELRVKLEQWRSAVLDQEKLQMKYRNQHPSVGAAVHICQSLHETIQDLVNQSHGAIRAKIALLEQQSMGMQAKAEEQRKLATDLDIELVETMAKLTALDRGRQAEDMSFRGLLNRIEEARLSADENTASVSLVERASPPMMPFYPNTRRTLILGLLMGLAGGMGLAILKEIMEDKISTTADVENMGGLPVLGVVPHASTSNRKMLACVSLTRSDVHVSEAFAGIRGVLVSAQHGEQSRCLLVTSTAPEDGKTIISSNLALTYGQSGTRTLLVDFDLRRPRIEAIYDISQKAPSLAHVLTDEQAGEKDFESLVQPTSCPNLFIISSRADRKLNAARIMAGSVVHRFMDWAKKHYDQIIVDAPPHGLVGDAIILAGLTDGVVIVCRAKRTRRRALRHTVNHFTNLGAHMIGAVVNDVPIGKGSYFTEYAYYSHEYVHGEPTSPKA